MKLSRFAVLLAVLALAVSMPAFADTINLLGPSSYSWAYVYTSPTGVGLIETYTANVNSWFETEVAQGSTKGNVTTFSFGMFTTSLFGGLFWTNLTNASFNAKTDTFTGTFMIGGVKWHFTEVFNPLTSPSYTQGNQSYSRFMSAQSGQSLTLKSANVSTVPEPGTLALFGTGIVGMAGVMRKKLSILPRCNG